MQEVSRSGERVSGSSLKASILPIKWGPRVIMMEKVLEV